MAKETEAPLQLLKARQLWKIIKTDPKLWISIFFFTLGYISLLTQIDWSNVPILGLLFDNLQEVMLASGKLIRLIILSFTGVLIYRFLYVGFSGGLFADEDWEGKPVMGSRKLGVMVMLVFILLWLYFAAPKLLPQMFEQTEVMSVIWGG